MKFGAIVTDAGTRKIMDAVHEGKKVNIVDFAVGDGGGVPCTPEFEATGLVNELWRGKVDACYISEESENLLLIETVMPSDVGGFTIREMGVFDDDGILIAVCNTPETQKVRISDGVVHELNLIMEIALSNVDRIELTVDPCVLMATKKDIEDVRKRMDNFIQHMTDPNDIEYAFYFVFAKVMNNQDALGEALSDTDITEAMSEPWNGQASSDPKALSDTDITEAMGEPWNGQTSSDPKALSDTDITEAIKNVVL